MADARRLMALGTQADLAKELADQINSAGITPAPAQADSTASDVAELVTDFNDLLAKLRTAGIITP